MAPKEYSCVKKTRQSFEDSLAEISKSKPINKITVKELCEMAGLSRNAFYFHYTDINELVESIENNMIDKVTSYLDDFDKMGFPDNMLETIKQLPSLFFSRRDISLMLLDCSVSFTKRLNKIFSDFNYKYYTQYHKQVARTKYEYFYNFISDGFYGMLRRWLREPDVLTMDEFVSLTYTLVKRLLVPGDPEIEFVIKNDQK